MRLRPASGGRESPDFSGAHMVNQGIDIPRSPKQSINSNRVKNIMRIEDLTGKCRDFGLYALLSREPPLSRQGHPLIAHRFNGGSAPV